MSHKWVTAVLVCICVSCAARPARAGQLVYEPFDYPPGDILDGKVAPNGQTWSAAGDLTKTPIIVTNAFGLSVPGLAPARGVSVTYGGAGASERLGVAPIPISSGTLYYSLALQVTSLGPHTPIFIAGFNTLTGPQNGQPTVAGTRLYVQTDVNTGVRLGVAKNSSVVADIGFESATHPLGETIFVVGSYEIVDPTLTGTDDISRLWVNPDPATFDASSAPAPTVTAPITGKDLGIGRTPTLASFLLRQGIATMPDLVVDELRVGTTWADVTPTKAGPPVIPLPAAALPAMAMIAAIIGLQFLRRRAYFSLSR